MMDRREALTWLAIATGAAASLPANLRAHPGAEKLPRPKIAMLVHPKMVMLDLVTAQTAFALAMSDIDLVWKTRDPVPTDLGIAVTPTKTFDEVADRLDVLFVPGGLAGTIVCMKDEHVLSFLNEKGSSARFVTSVCTGSLLLGAAGLLAGYEATGHWHSCELLPMFGARLRRERVVIDRNRITGGGVTAGLDFGLQVAAKLRDAEWAKSIQLVLEYDPQPPYTAGTPAGAGASVVRLADHVLRPELEEARRVAREVGRKLRL